MQHLHHHWEKCQRDTKSYPMSCCLRLQSVLMSLSHRHLVHLFLQEATSNHLSKYSVPCKWVTVPLPRWWQPSITKCDNFNDILMRLPYPATLPIQLMTLAALGWPNNDLLCTTDNRCFSKLSSDQWRKCQNLNTAGLLSQHFTSLE